jgi:hypothetical protein
MTARPFRLTPPPVYEEDIHVTVAHLLDLCLAPPAIWFHYPAGGYELPPHVAARLVRMGLKRSLPDIWILHQGVFLIELKRPGGKLSKTRVGRTRRGAPRVLIGQEEMFQRLLETGAVTAIGIAESVDEVLATLERWQIPLRGRPNPQDGPAARSRAPPNSPVPGSAIR